MQTSNLSFVRISRVVSSRQVCSKFTTGGRSATATARWPPTMMAGIMMSAPAAEQEAAGHLGTSAGKKHPDREN
jgi:hypothetical protein